jgi:hypothetical protein
MNQISDQSLVYLVQLVSEKLKLLGAEIDERAEDPLAVDIEEERFLCSMAAAELKKLYMEATKTPGNMPPYSRLIAD